MPSFDPAVDAYIKKSPRFAQPILDHLRKLIHKACPGVEETIKWSCPHYVLNGKILCSIAAFKNHCILGFRMASLMKDPKKILETKEKNAMGHLGRIETPADLPRDSVLMSYLKEAALLNAENFKGPARKRSAAKRKYTMPKEFADAVIKNKLAKKAFDNLSEPKQYEYIEWIAEAKTDSTRKARIATAMEWLKEGKSRNWKYM